MANCATPGCKCHALKNDELCFQHSAQPEIVEKRKESRKRGGSVQLTLQEKETVANLRAIEIKELSANLGMSLNDVGQAMGHKSAYAKRAVSWKYFLEIGRSMASIGKLQKEVLKFLRERKQQEGYVKAPALAEKENTETINREDQIMQKATTSMGKTMELIESKNTEKAKELEIFNEDPAYRLSQVRNELEKINQEATTTRDRISELRKSEENASRLSVMELVKHKRTRQRELNGQLADLEVVLAPLTDLQKLEKELASEIKAAALAELSDSLRGLEDKIQRMNASIIGDIGAALTVIDQLTN